MTTALRIEYTFYSWHCDFPDAIEQALEDDYVMNRHFYTKQTLESIKLLLLIDPDISPDYLLETIKNLPPSTTEPLLQV
jgi:hypothetical protein